MGRKRPDKGGRRGGRRKGTPPGEQRRDDAPNSRLGAGADVSGSSRLLLTRLAREGEIWDVYVATIAQIGASNITQLEFERKGARWEKLRYTRPVGELLLDALHSGLPVSRASLEEELDLALRDSSSNSL
jgi:hypothetical protein